MIGHNYSQSLLSPLQTLPMSFLYSEFDSNLPSHPELTTLSLSDVTRTLDSTTPVSPFPTSDSIGSIFRVQPLISVHRSLVVLILSHRFRNVFLYILLPFYLHKHHPANVKLGLITERTQMTEHYTDTS